MPDFILADHGSIVVLTPTSDAARAWREEHLNHPETQSWGRGVVIEPRYLPPVLDGISEDGLGVVAVSAIANAS